MNLAKLDLNLLLVFDAIMSERHVTKAGEKLFLSQSAMSNALKRLRFHLNDELFVRSYEGMRPTPRAIELAKPIRESLQQIELALEPKDFDPKTAHQTFTLGTNDYCVPVLIPKLLAYLEKQAPGINIRLISSAGKTLELLEAGEIDFGISAFYKIPEKFCFDILFNDNYVLIMRNQHPLAATKITQEQFIAARHMVVSPKGEHFGFVDMILAKKKLSRQVAITVNNFSAAPDILIQSDVILTVPQRIANTFTSQYELTTQPAIFEGPEEYTTSKLVWNKRLSDNLSHRWFRQLLQKTAASII